MYNMKGERKGERRREKNKIKKNRCFYYQFNYFIVWFLNYIENNFFSLIIINIINIGLYMINGECLNRRKF